MATKLTFHLSEQLKTELTQPNGTNAANGVYAYLWYNHPTQKGANFTTLVENGVWKGGSESTNTSTWDVDVPLSSGEAGKVYFIVQSEAIGAPHDDLTKKIGTDQSLIDPLHAVEWHFGYDTIEFTLSGKSSDVANLSAINSFSHQLGISVGGYQSGPVQARGYSSAFSADQLAAEIAKIATDKGAASPLVPYPAGSTGALWDSGKAANMITITPAGAAAGATPAAFKPEDWDGYVNAVLGMTDIVLTGYFNGAYGGDDNNPGVYHNGAYYAYALSHLAKKPAGLPDGDYILLSPTGASQVQGYIVVSTESLKANLYAPGSSGAGASAYLFSDKALTTPFAVDGKHADGSFNTGANTQWGKIFTELFTGFSGGYLGATAHSAAHVLSNGQSKLPDDTVNLNHTWNWDPTFAFDNGRSNPVPTTYQHFDPYAKLFFDHTNVYGGAYSDALTTNFTTSVTVPIWDNPGQKTGANVPVIDVWAFGVGEAMNTVPGTDTMPGGAVPFHVPSSRNNWIDVPATGDYAKDRLGLGAGQNISFDFSDPTSGLTLDIDAAHIQFGVYAGDGTFTYLSLPSDLHGDDLWRVYTLTKAGSGYSLTPDPTPFEIPGHFVIKGLTQAGPATTQVYQLVVGAQHFTVYADTDDSGGFVGAAVDGLATAIKGDAVAFTVYFAPGSLDPSLLAPITHPKAVPQSPIQYKAPVMGTLSGGSFTPITNLALTAWSTANVFGWSGAGSSATIKEMTNKIHANATARVDITLNGAVVATATGNPDLDGAWVTKTLDNPLTKSGAYEARLVETIGGQAVSRPSDPLAFTLTLSTVEQTQAAFKSASISTLQLYAATGTQVLDSIDDGIVFGLRKALSLGGMVVDSGDHAVVRARGAALGALSAAQVADLDARNFDRLDASDDHVALRVDQVRALGDLKLSAGDDVVLRDTGTAIATLTLQQVARLAGHGIDRIDATDDALTISVDKALALGPVQLDSGDDVTVTGSGLRLSLVLPSNIAKLAAAGVDHLDSTTDKLTLTLAQFKALGGIALMPADALTLLGGLGDDVIDIGGQALGAEDRILGGFGDDLYRIGASPVRVVEFALGGRDTIEASISIDLPEHVEALVLTGSDDIDGTAASTTSTLTGNAGANHLTGQGGDDSLQGGLGADTLEGGLGADWLDGGDGADAFRFGNPRQGGDVIVDFLSGVDRIELGQGFKGIGAPGVLDASHFATGGPSAAVAQILYDAATSVLSFDADGTGGKAAVVIATLDGAPALAASDVLLLA